MSNRPWGAHGASKRFVTALLIMLVPATMIGALFPLVGSMHVQDLRRTGSDVGKLYAVNSIGNVFGALAPGSPSLALPIFGIQKGIVLMAALNVSIGLYVFLLGSKSAARPRYGVPQSCFLLAVVVLSRADFDFRFPGRA